MRRSHDASGRQRELNAEKSTHHRNGVVAPQSAVAPDNLFRHAYDPAGYTVVSGKDKLPSSPNFVSGSWADFIRVIVSVVAETILVAVVMLTCVEGVVWVIFSNIGFERSIVRGFQTGWWSGFSQWNDMIIDQVLIVAGCMGVEFAFRNFLSVAAGYRHLIPMGAKAN